MTPAYRTFSETAAMLIGEMFLVAFLLRRVKPCFDSREVVAREEEQRTLNAKTRQEADGLLTLLAT